MNIQISNVAIRQNDNQFYNLNDLHKASGKEARHEPYNWLRTQQTQELIAEIEAEGGKACEVINGGKNRGTFVCKELVYAYATWISAKFFLLVIRTFDAYVSGSLKTIPQQNTVETRAGLVKAVRQLARMKKMDYSDAFHLVHNRFNVDNVEALLPEQIIEATEYIQKLTLSGEVLDKPIQSTVRLEEFELIRVMAFLSNRYMEMQTASCVARAIFPLNPQMAKDMKSEFERDFPLLKGIAHTFQRFSGSLKDPLCAKEFEMHAKYLQGANLAW